MKVFKYIFRLDYKRFLNLVDQFGTTIELIQNTFSGQDLKIEEQKSDSLSRNFIFRGSLSTGPFSLTLNPTTFAGNIEFENGLSPEEISKHEYVKKCNSIFSETILQNITYYERIGFRIHAISNLDIFSYKNLSSYFLQKNDYYKKIYEKNIPQVNDVGIVFESIYKEAESLRIDIGPYRELEKEKFFTIDPKIKEGLIADIDLWQWKIKLTKPNLQNMISKNNLVFKQLTENIIHTFKEETKK